MMESTRITPELGSAKKEKNQNIQVFVRVRPMSGQENAKHAAQVVDTPGSREVVVRDRTVSNVTKTFTFDRVFGAKSKQVDVYRTVVAPLLNEVLLGYNCTVFAYGQTGTGKTFTMEGERSQKGVQTVENDPLAGILPRALSQLFDEVRLMNCEFTVRVSFLELYNEELFDLLAPIDESKHKTLRLFEDSHRKGSVIIQGLEEVIVNNKQEVYAVLDRGSQQRRTAATLMNAHSSRSHTIFTITVHMKESSVEGEEMLKVGKLHLVDLAGSENIGKSGAVEKRAREAGSINQSLLTLGRVISSLVERTPHIPYRESKLTRLLQDSLGGKTKTSIIATVSPAASNIEETLSTLDYAHRAKNIMNKPEVNQKLTKKEALNIYTDEIERLRRDLNATRDKTGIYIDQENYNRTMYQISAQHAELNEKSSKIRELEALLAEREEQCREYETTIEDLGVDIQVKQAMLQDAKIRQEQLGKKVLNAERRSDELKYLVKYHLESEEKMTGEASNLLNTANDSVSVIETLHGRLERKQTTEDRNWVNSQRFREDFRKSIDDIVTVVNILRDGHTVAMSDILNIIDARSDERNKLVETINEVLNTTSNSINALDVVMMENVGKLTDLVECRTTDAAELMEHQSNKVQETMQERMKAITNNTEALKITLHNAIADNKKLEKEIEGKFHQVSTELKKSLKSSVKVFDRLETVINEIKKKLGDLLNDGTAHFNNFKSNQDKYKDESSRKIEEMRETLTYFVQKAEGMHKCLNELQVDTNSQLQNSAGIFKQFVQDVDAVGKATEVVGDDSIKSVKESRTSTQNIISKFSTYTDLNVKNPKKALSDITEKLQGGVQTCSTLTETTNTCISDQKAGLGEIVKSVEKSNETYLKQVEIHGLEMRNAVLKRAGDTVLMRESAHNAVRVITEGEAKSTKTVMKGIDGQCDHVSDNSTKINSMLQHAAGNVDEFWEETYLVDTPSGSTPSRRKYDLPAKLTLPSPHSRVMERYRLRSKGVLYAIEDLANVPDDLDCSWSDGYFKNLKVPIENADPLQDVEEENEFEDENKENTLISN